MTSNHETIHFTSKKKKNWKVQRRRKLYTSRYSKQRGNPKYIRRKPCASPMTWLKAQSLTRRELQKIRTGLKRHKMIRKTLDCKRNSWWMIRAQGRHQKSVAIGCRHVDAHHYRLKTWPCLATAPLQTAETTDCRRRGPRADVRPAPQLIWRVVTSNRAPIDQNVPFQRLVMGLPAFLTLLFDLVPSGEKIIRHHKKNHQ
jgi:hypothetical protein